MQCLLTESEEGRPGAVGLNVTPGKVKKFPAGDLKVPQIGWNELTFPRESLLFKGVREREMVYFLHSFYCAPNDETSVIACADYGVQYCAALWSGNVFATQFHPEKSGEVGLTILKNFASI
jgi:glutamine amidotransferase